MKIEMNVRKMIPDVRHQNAETLLDLTSNIYFLNFKMLDDMHSNLF